MPEAALLTSLEEAVREITSERALNGEPAWAHEIQEAVEEIRRFRYAFGPLLEHAAAVQQQLHRDPDIHDLQPLRIGPDGQLSPDALELGTRLLQLPAMTALGTAAAAHGCKGMGFLTANVEAGVIVGGQAGAELVWLWPYKIGNYTTPNRVVGRAWYTETIGVDLGYSLTLAPFPLDLSFWFLPPENTKHMVGAYVGYEGPPFPGPIPLPIGIPLPLFAGLRVELFGWIPATSATEPEPPAEPGSIITDAFKYISGFRIIAEAGLHIAIGLTRKGQQVTTAGGIDLATYTLTPSNLQTGRQYDGSDRHPLISGRITAPLRDAQPSKTFQKGVSTLKLVFPTWMCTGTTIAAPLKFVNDGSGGTTGWKLTNQPSATNPTYEYQWVGVDSQVWDADIDFTVGAYSSTTPPQNGRSTFGMTKLGSVGTVNMPMADGICAMKLSAQVFSASGTYTLTTDPKVNTIKDYSGATIATTMTADSSDASPNPNHFYYLPNPEHPTEPLIIDYPAKQTSWYVGYQFQQQPGASNAQFRPVFWEVGKPFFPVYYYVGDWMSLIEPTQQYTSTVTWSGGAVTNGAKLVINLTPSAST